MRNENLLFWPAEQTRKISGSHARSLQPFRLPIFLPLLPGSESPVCQLGEVKSCRTKECAKGKPERRKTLLQKQYPQREHFTSWISQSWLSFFGGTSAQNDVIFPGVQGFEFSCLQSGVCAWPKNRRKLKNTNLFFARQCHKIQFAVGNRLWKLIPCSHKNLTLARTFIDHRGSIFFAWKSSLPLACMIALTKSRKKSQDNIADFATPKPREYP